jgi:CheY-like chemotaxis protein
MKPLSLDTDSPRWPAVVIQAAADASDELERMHNIAKRAKIMMVDDEELNLRAIEKTLRRYGYESFINITNACQAVPLIAAEQPDLLLLDIMMPVINGLDILRQLRSQPRFQCLPIIVLTAYCDPETRRHALQAGCMAMSIEKGATARRWRASKRGPP